MKILYLYDNYPSYRKDFFELLNKKLKHEGHEFAFYYGSKKDNASRQETESDFITKRFPIVSSKWAGIDFLCFKGFKQEFIDFKPDVVVLQFHVAILSYWWTYYYMRRHNIPFIIWDCNYTRDTLGGLSVKIRRALVDYTYKKASACITYGTVFRDYLIRLGRKPTDIFVAQNTINIGSIISKRSSICANRLFDHPIRFLYVGALLDRKYVHTAVSAISRIINDGYDVYFDIIGDGPEKAKIGQIIRENKMTERIIMHGPKHGEEVKSFFEGDDVFILPGTGGLAINEAMAYAMPIISTVGDDTVVDLIDGNGILLKEFGNIEEIVFAIRCFLNTSTEEKQLMSQRSEKIVCEKASLDNMANQHMKAIIHVLNTRKK